MLLRRASKPSVFVAVATLPSHGAVGLLSHREYMGLHVCHVLPTIGVYHLLSVYG